MLYIYIFCEFQKYCFERMILFINISFKKIIVLNFIKFLIQKGYFFKKIIIWKNGILRFLNKWDKDFYIYIKL